MICPMCRAPYSLKTNVNPGRRPCLTSAVVEDDAVVCKVENFPMRYWRKMRAVLREHRIEEDRAEQRLIASYHEESESILDDTLETVLGTAQQFFLMLSVGNGGDRDTIQYMPLNRINDNISAINEDMFRFSVQRTSLRRFTTLVNQIPSSGDTNGETIPRLMRSSVVLRVGSENDEQSFLYRVAQMTDIELPVFRIHDQGSIDSSLTENVLSMEQAVETLLGMRMDEQHVSDDAVSDNAVLNGESGTSVTGISTIEENDVVMLPVSEEQLSLIDLDETPNAESSPSIQIPSATIPMPRITTANTLSGDTPTAMRLSLLRYTTVCAPCLDMIGILTLQLCESVFSGGIDSIHAITLSLQACALMSEVARCFAGQ